MSDLETALSGGAEPDLAPAIPETPASDRLMAAFDADPTPAPAPEPEASPEPEPAPESDTGALDDPAGAAASTEPADGEPISLLGEGQQAEADPKPDEKPAEDAPKPDEKAPEPDEKAEDAAAEPEKPYEIELPEGVKAETLDQEAFGKFKEFMQGAKVDPTKAKELLAMHQAEIAKRETAAWDNFRAYSQKAYNDTRAQWRNEVLSDPEVGGARTQTTMLRCREVIEKFGGTPEQRQALYQRMNTTAMGDSLPLVRLLANVWASTMKEGEIVASQPRGGRQESPRSTQDIANVLFDT